MVCPFFKKRWVITFSKLWKKSDEYEFLKLSPAQTLQQTLKQLERAFKDAFGKKQPLKKIPTFKKRGDRDSFTLPQGFKIEGSRLSFPESVLPKIAWVNFRKSRDIEGIAKNVTISRQGKHWFVSIQVEVELAEPVHPSNTMICVDMGVKRLFTLSEGELRSKRGCPGVRHNRTGRLTDCKHDEISKR